MTFDDRLTWLLVGVVIGFFMSYVTRTLRETLEGVREVVELMKTNPPRKRDESGAFKLPSWQNAALFLVVALTVVASVQSQVASNKADDNQDQLASIVGCVISSQNQFLDAINTRTGYTQAQASANKDLQTAQKVFFGVLLHIPPYTAVVREQAARDYQHALDVFLKAATASEINAKVTKYPEAEDMMRCIKEKKG